MASEKIRALVIDDSTFMVTILSDILEKDERIEVIDSGKNGVEALKLNQEKDPDVILMDIEMPVMDGLTATKKIMAEDPTPIVILSALANEHANMSVKALDAGAVDFIPKTSGSMSMDIRKKSDVITRKIIHAAKGEVKRVEEKETEERKLRSKRGKDHLVVIGSSTGGTRALDELLSVLPDNFPTPIVVVQHMPSKFTSHLAKTLDSKIELAVKEIVERDRLDSGFVYIIKAGKHGVIKSWQGNRVISLNEEEKLHGVRPSADYLFKSAAEKFQDQTVGIVLTGMGKDGALGAKMIKEKDGLVAVQDEDSSVIYGMPKTAKEMGGADFEGAPSEIADWLIGLFMEEAA